MIIVHTKDTMHQIYLDALKIRQQVFVHEQNVPAALEIDANEAYAIHFVLYDGKPKATLRLLPINSQTVKIQRMAVSREFRNQGLGQQLVLAAETFAKEQGFKEISLGAQIQAAGFYAQLAYQRLGEPFVKAGIEHVTMSKILA
ncbi:MAG: GNAT family N-acetyltransferase [Enterococcus sp.]